MADIEALKAERLTLEGFLQAGAAGLLRARFLERQVGLFNVDWLAADPVGYEALNAECQSLKAEAEVIHAREMAASKRLREILPILQNHREEFEDPMRNPGLGALL